MASLSKPSVAITLSCILVPYSVVLLSQIGWSKILVGFDNFKKFLHSFVEIDRLFEFASHSAHGLKLIHNIPSVDIADVPNPHDFTFKGILPTTDCHSILVTNF